MEQYRIEGPIIEELRQKQSSTRFCKEIHGRLANYGEEAKRRDKRPFDLAVSDCFRGRNLLVEYY